MLFLVLSFAFLFLLFALLLLALLLFQAIKFPVKRKTQIILSIQLSSQSLIIGAACSLLVHYVLHKAQVYVTCKWPVKHHVKVQLFSVFLKFKNISLSIEMMDIYIYTVD